jgi:hypothetical protein
MVLGAVQITQQPEYHNEILSQGDNGFCFTFCLRPTWQHANRPNAHFSRDILSSFFSLNPIAGQGVDFGAS